MHVFEIVRNEIDRRQVAKYSHKHIAWVPTLPPDSEGDPEWGVIDTPDIKCLTYVLPVPLHCMPHIFIPKGFTFNCDLKPTKSKYISRKTPLNWRHSGDVRRQLSQMDGDCRVTFIDPKLIRLQFPKQRATSIWRNLHLIRVPLEEQHQFYTANAYPCYPQDFPPEPDNTKFVMVFAKKIASGATLEDPNDGMLVGTVISHSRGVGVGRIDVNCNLQKCVLSHPRWKSVVTASIRPLNFRHPHTL